MKVPETFNKYADEEDYQHLQEILPSLQGLIDLGLAPRIVGYDSQSSILELQRINGYPFDELPQDVACSPRFAESFFELQSAIRKHGLIQTDTYRGNFIYDPVAGKSVVVDFESIYPASKYPPIMSIEESYDFETATVLASILTGIHITSSVEELQFLGLINSLKLSELKLWSQRTEAGIKLRQAVHEEGGVELNDNTFIPGIYESYNRLSTPNLYLSQIVWINNSSAIRDQIPSGLYERITRNLNRNFVLRNRNLWK
jgi:hypothetical protein